MKDKQYYVYILRNNGGMFYTGVTNDLVRRLYEHKNKLLEGYTSKYTINKLVYYEIYQDSLTAIEREKQVKKWNRKKKIMLISKTNPRFEEIFLI